MASKRRRTPKKIKIGYSEFKIIPRSHIWGKRNKAFGQCQAEDAKIEYDNTQTDNELPNTILHEVLHGIAYMFDIKFRNIKDEEQVIRKMANGLHTVFVDNPHFLEWLIRKIKK